MCLYVQEFEMWYCARCYGSYVKIVGSQRARKYNVYKKKTWNIISYKQMLRTIYIASGETFSIVVQHSIFYIADSDM